MRRSWVPVLILLAGCDGPRFWKDRYLQEVNYHYQTQQIKNAEIAARDLEIETQKSVIRILEDRIGTLDAQVAQRPGKPVPKPTPGSIEGRVSGVDLILLSVGREDGVAEGMEFSITREGRPVGKAVVERVDATSCAARLKEKKQDPKAGDLAVHPSP